MAAEVPQTLEYMDGQLNAALVLEVENFTNWKKRKPEGQWTADERKAANLDQRLKSLIMFVLPNDQMNSFINCLTAKSTWDDLILYHEGPSDVKESRAIDLKLCYNTFKFKEEVAKFLAKSQKHKYVKDSELASLFGKLKYKENIIDSIYETKKKKFIVFITPLSTSFFSNSSVQDFQDSPDDEEDTRSSQEFSCARATDQTECHKCGKKGHFARDCWSKISIPSYQSPFHLKSLSSSQHQPELKPTKYFEAKYNKVKAKLALPSLSASASKASMVKNKGLIAEAYEWDEEEVSLDDNEMVEVKVLMVLDEDNKTVSKEGARNGECIKISMRKVHTLLEMEDNDDRKNYQDYLCIDLNYVEEQRNNLLSKHRNLAQELKTCKEQLLFWEKRPSLCKIWLSQAEGFIPPNHDTSRILPAESQRNTTHPLVTVTDSLATDYDSANESLVCSTLLLPLEKLGGAEPIFGPKTIKSILKSNSTFKSEALKGIIINKSSSVPTKGNNSSSASKVNSAPAGKLKNVKIEDGPPLAICKRTDQITCDHAEFMSTINMTQLCGSYDHDTNGHNRIISLKREIKPRNLQHVIKRCEACGSTVHTTTDHYDIEWFRRGEALQAKNVEALRSKKTGSSNANRSKTPTKWRIFEHTSSPNVEDTLVQDTILILNTPLPIPSVVTPAPQDRWSQDKHIELVNIIGNPGAGMLIRAMAKQLSAASAHECLFVDFLSKEEPKKVSEALKHPGWVDAMQDELN
ncbi:retrovirus-related pol polyprotein from transposon TNT 1-94 [Tanacetum coccineum]